MTRQSRRFISGVACALLLTAVPRLGVAASEPSPSEVAVALQFFAEADALRKQGRWLAASDKLRQAIAIKDTPGLRYHLGFCQVQLGNLVEGLVEYDRADKMIRSGAPAPDVQRLLAVARDELRDRVPLLTIEVPAGTTNAVLHVDQRQVSASLVGRPIPLNPGKHTLRVARVGYKTFSRTVELEESQRLVVKAQLEVAPGPVLVPAAPTLSTSGAQKPPANSPATSGMSTRTYWLIGEAGFTLISAGVGAVFNFVVASRETAIAHNQHAANEYYKWAHEETKNMDVSNVSCSKVDPTVEQWGKVCAGLDQAIFERNRAQTLQVVGFVGAGVGASAFLATLLFWPKEKPQKHSVYVHTLPVQTGFVGEIGWRF